MNYKCELCGAVTETAQYCEFCAHDYQEDIQNGNFPEGLNLNRFQYYNFANWRHVKKILNDLEAGEITEQSAKMQVDSIVKYLNEASVADLLKRDKLAELHKKHHK